MKNCQLLNGFLVAGAVSVLVSKPAIAQVTQVTGVKLNPTPNGLQVLLETTGDKSPQIVTSKYNQTLLIDIFNTQLNLPDGEKFSTNNPTDSITTVTINRLYNNSVRVTVVGSTALPKAEVVLTPQVTALEPTTANPTQPIATEPTTPETTTSETSTPTNTAPESAQTPIAPTEPPESDVAPPDDEQEDDLEIVVTGRREGGYIVERSTTATKTDIPLRDIPQSIQVVPRQVIEEQQITRIGDAARNVSGVTPRPGYGGSTDNYTIRGFQASTNLRNGFRDDGFVSFIDPVNIERIEVLKGPASVLYGQFEPGGVVNYITKRPLSQPYYAGEITVGSYSFYRPTLDISGPLNNDKTLAYRLNLAYENSGSFRDFVNGKLFVAAPVLAYKLGESTTLTLDYEYINLDRTFDRGLVPERPSFNLPISRFLGEPDDNYKLSINKPSYILEHKFNDNLQIRNSFSAQIAEVERNNAQARTFTLQADGRTLRRRYTQSEEIAKNYSLQTDLIGKFNTGSIEHNLLIGLELRKDNDNYILRRAEFASIDIFNPIYGSPKPTTFSTVFTGDRTSENVGIYLQDQLTLSPNLKLIAGGRLDFTNLNLVDTTNGEVTTASRSYQAFSPRIGLVYQPIQPISLYASYSTSFKPDVLSRTENGNLLEPQKGSQYELGVKAELLDGRLITTLAAYQLNKTNVAITNPNNIDFQIPAGEIKSRGIELDVIGKITPAWNIIASYGLNDSFISKSSDPDTFPEGNKLINAPSQSGSLWTTYEIQSGNLQGLGFGTGLFFVGDREAQIPNNLKVPSYVRTDAAIFYRRDKYKVGLNFKNIFGIRYYDVSEGSLLYPGAPFTVLGTFSIQF